MALQEAVIPVNLGMGIDTKTDPKMVVAGKMLRLENAIFTNAKRIAKRNGYAALNPQIASFGAIANPQMVRSFQNQLVVADQGILATRTPSQSAWINAGNYTSTELTKNTIDQTHAVSGYTDCAILGNYILYGWSTATQQNIAEPIVPCKTFGSVVDNQTGAILVDQLLSTASGTFIDNTRCVLLGSTVLAIVYIKADGSNLVMRLVNFAGSGVVTFGPELILTTNFSLGSFDVVNTSTGAALFYKSTTGVTISTINTAGAIVNTVNVVDGTAGTGAAPKHIKVDPTNGNIWIYWTDTDAGGGPPTFCRIVYSIYSPVLALVLAKTTIVTLAAPFYVTNMTVVSNSPTVQSVYFGQYLIMGGVRYVDSTWFNTGSNTGLIGATTLWAHGVTPYSHTFTALSSGSTKTYGVFLYRSGNLVLTGNNTPLSEPTFFTIEINNNTGIPLVVGRFVSGLANLQNTLEVVIAYTPNVSTISVSKKLFACGVENQSFPSDAYTSLEFFPGGLAGAFAYTIDFNSANSYKGINCSQLLMLNGGVTQNFDGQSVNEFGFHLFPEIPNLSQSNTGSGAIAPGLYSYLAIFQWTDAQGNLHQSAPSLAQSITVVGPNNTVTVSVTNAYLSQKQGVSVAIYRTQVNGTVYFLVTDPVFVASADASNSFKVQFADVFSDAQISGNPQAYTYPASAVLENSTPPPSMIMLAHNNRLWFVDSENPNTEWYTKSFQPGVGLSPSALMTQTIDPKFGNITLLAEMDDKLVTVKQSGIFIQSGDGVNDVGTGATLSFPQVVPSDVGCSNLKSAVLTPMGIMFQTVNGIYMLGRSLNVTYKGFEVEQYNNQTVTSADLVPGKSQIRFLCSSGLTLVYDYIFEQWSTFTNHIGTSATIWNGSYVYANTAGLVLQEIPGLYTDNGVGFSLLAQTSWLAISSVQNFQRVRRLAILGDFTNGANPNHAIQIQAAYDFNPTLSTAIPYVFGAALASSALQYRERLPQQKCDSISLLIQEVNTGDSLEYLDLSNISFEAGMKKGINKLASAQSVG